MFKRATAVTLMLAVFLTLLAVAPAVCSAAADKPAQLTVQVVINEPKTFWTYPYITKDDGKIRMPAAVTVEWSTTNGVSSSKGEVFQAGQKRGEYVITTERGTYVDVEVQVVDSNKVVLGKSGMQVRNNGQKVMFTVYLPDSTNPTFLSE